MQKITLFYQSDTVSEMITVLNRCYTQDVLRRIVAMSVKSFMLKNEINVLTAEGTPTTLNACCIKIPNNLTTASKAELLRLLAFVISPPNILTWFKTLPEGEQEFFRRLIRDLYVDADAAEALTKRKMKSQHGWSLFFRSDYPWCPLVSVFEDSSFKTHAYFVLPKELHPYFNPILFEDEFGQNDDLFMEPPSDDSVIDLEAESLALLVNMKSYFDQGVVSLAETKLVSAATVKAFAKLGGTELPVSDDSCKNLRIRMLANVAAIIQHLSERRIILAKQMMHENVRATFDRLDTFGSSFTPLFTEHLKGLSSNERKSDNYLAVFHDFLCSFLHGSDQEWVSVENLFKAAYIMLGKDIMCYAGIHPRGRYVTSVLTNKITGRPITADKLIEQVGQPMIRALLMFYASMGLVKFSYTPSQQIDNPTTPYDCIDAVCLTGLGRYVLGLVDTYTMPELDNKQSFEISDTNLVIRVLDTNTPYMYILESLAQEIGNNRWVVTASSVLKDCKSRADIERKIDLFKKFFASELPQVWKDFFQSLLDHCNPFSDQKLGTYYRLFEVKHDDQRLIDIIMRDEVVRSLIIRAENYLILVKTANLNSLERRLKELGYLM